MPPFPRTRASRAQPRALPREARAMAIDLPLGGRGGNWGGRRARAGEKKSDEWGRVPGGGGVHRRGGKKVRKCLRLCVCLCEWVLLLSSVPLPCPTSTHRSSELRPSVLLQRLNTSPPPSVSLSPPTHPATPLTHSLTPSFLSLSLSLPFALAAASLVLRAL